MTPAVRQILARPGWVLPLNPDIQFDFVRGAAWKGTGTGGGAVVPVESLLTVVRASAATDLLPTSPTGFPYASFVANQLARSPNIGALIFEARTNLLLNSTAPATQTTGSLANGVYTLWVNGSGSVSPAAGTAVGTGFSAALQGAPSNFTITTPGTVVVTVSGALNAFQLELGTFGTSLIVTVGATATRAADVITVNNPPPATAAFSAFVRFTPASAITFATTQTLFTYSNGTLTERLGGLRVATTGRMNLLDVVGNSSQTVPSTTDAVAQNTRGRWAAAAAVGSAAMVQDGGTVNISAPAAMPTGLTTLYLGVRGDGSTQYANATVNSMAFWMWRRLGNLELRDLQ